MYIFKKGLKNKEIKFIDRVLDDTPDLMGDFYCVKDGIRLPLRENREILYKYIRFGDSVVYDDEGKGLALITGIADKTKRRYIKILSRDNKVVNNILKLVSWNIFNTDLYIQVHKNSKFMSTFQHNNFYLHKDLGNELILVRKGRPYIYQNIKELKGEIEDEHNHTKKQNKKLSRGFFAKR